MLLRLIVAIMLVAAQGWAQKPATSPPVAAGSTPLLLLTMMPMQLQGMSRLSLTDYAVTARDPRLGASVGYSSPQGAIGTIYLYDGGQPDIEGVNSAALVDGQLQSALNDVRNAAIQRGWRVVSEQAASVQGMRCTLFGLRTAEGRAVETAACVGTHRGLFLKLRYTNSPNAPSMLVENLTMFTRAVLGALV